MTNRSAVFMAAVCTAVLYLSTGNAAQTARKPQPQSQKPTTAPANAQGKQSNDDTFQLNVDVQIVEIPVSVTNKDGAIINNLPQSSFQVFEDKIQQEIKEFKHEDIPLSVGLV